MVKIVSLSEEAYETLDRLKLPGDSFSEVVLRMAELERHRRLESTFGSWKMPDKDYREFMEGIWERRRQSKPRRVGP